MGTRFWELAAIQTGENQGEAPSLQLEECARAGRSGGHLWLWQSDTSYDIDCSSGMCWPEWPGSQQDSTQSLCLQREKMRGDKVSERDRKRHSLNIKRKQEERIDTWRELFNTNPQKPISSALKILQYLKFPHLISHIWSNFYNETDRSVNFTPKCECLIVKSPQAADYKIQYFLNFKCYKGTEGESVKLAIVMYWL